MSYLADHFPKDVAVGVVVGTVLGLAGATLAYQGAITYFTRTYPNAPELLQAGWVLFLAYGAFFFLAGGAATLVIRSALHIRRQRLRSDAALKQDLDEIQRKNRNGAPFRTPPSLGSE